MLTSSGFMAEPGRTRGLMDMDPSSPSWRRLSSEFSPWVEGPAFKGPQGPLRSSKGGTSLEDEKGPGIDASLLEA